MKLKVILLSGLLVGSSLALATQQPPTAWVGPSTGHCIVRLSRPPGSWSSYFTRNEFTPDGKWIVFRSNMDGAKQVHKVEIAKDQ